MKKLLSKIIKNVQRLYSEWFTFTKQDCMSDKQDIPVEDAFRMWKEEQRKKNGS